MNALVTGGAGFIGSHLSERLLEQGARVRAIDAFTDFYPRPLKECNLQNLRGRDNYEFIEGDLRELDLAKHLDGITHVFHLAAQAGVRYSLTHPDTYVSSNLVGFANLLESCRNHPPRHLLYASSSSVYGNGDTLPSRETARADTPLSLYAATKRANEAMAYSYAHLFGVPATGLRFFTVYGEWGRPDMAFFSFADAILSNRPITVYNGGLMARDFTYVGDAVEAVVRLINVIPASAGGSAPHRIVNVASGRRVPLLDFIAALEHALGRKADKQYQSMHAADVTETWADTSLLTELTGFEPQAKLETGVARFADWFKSWHDRPC